MNRLKQLRNSRGITQDELGRMLGVQKAAICKYENGRVNMPNSVIMRLVEIFQVSADYLLGTDEVVPLLKSSSAKLSSSSKPHAPAIGVPLVGFVHAGLPMLADENITEYIPVSANEVSSFALAECVSFATITNVRTTVRIVSKSKVIASIFIPFFFIKPFVLHSLIFHFNSAF